MIEEILKNKILVLDGAMGTMIQRFSLDENDFRGDHLKYILANQLEHMKTNLF